MTIGHAVVLGAGFAGIAAAAAIAPHANRVTVLERHPIPDTPTTRRGVPQARHAHLLWSGGARAIDRVLPGAMDALVAAGAHRIGLPSDLVSYTAQGWMRRFPPMQFLMTCSRDLLDWTLLGQLRAIPHVVIRDAVQVTTLRAHGRGVQGVGIKSQEGESSIDADLVVDARGRASNAPEWLQAMGLPEVLEETVDSGLAYATRIFRAPNGVRENVPLINVQADPNQRDSSGRQVPGRTATILPIEDGQWLVTLSGTRDGEPPTGEREFVEFACSAMRHSIVGDVIASLEPLTPVLGSRGLSTLNRRRFFERLPGWPHGFVVMGDAVATYNPVYGQGMSVAAQSAVVLGSEIARSGLTTLDSRRVQRLIGKTVSTPWIVATGQDILYPGAIGKAQPWTARLLQRYFERLIKVAAGRPEAAALLFEVFTLSGPPSRLLSAKAVASAIRGPADPPLTGPPLTTDEWILLGIEEAGQHSQT